MEDYEKLGAFYLGRLKDPTTHQDRDELLLYDAKDLTTHAVVVGMTGSGKTGLCLSLLEEAGIDGIPAIAIDPKGDIGNLLLTFPELSAGDFQPWIDPSEAARQGFAPEDYAEEVAKRWRKGLAGWHQGPERIKRLRETVDLAIYTPGSEAGLPLTVLRSFDPPPAAVRNDGDAYRERVSSAASGLLALLGIDADPVQSREHILIANILDHAWRAEEHLDIARLIQRIQSPPMTKVGIIDLETFFPAKDRVALSMTLNNLLASPSFAGWMQGEPLDIQRLLYTAEGKPRISILSIAHLSDAERMFFVTLLLNEVLAWVRSQPGTGSLRALLYMDEVFGYFPPTANPPSKGPMLTLLKQARAFGLGVVLATQNPVDLDYKGLSNTGTWFLGRLQTERDKLRVLEGLEGAAGESGASLDRRQLDELLSGLGSRVFLMNNVHEGQPVMFQTRWALSYLRGPLTRSQIQRLMEPRKAAADQQRDQRREAEREPEPPAMPRPVIPPDVEEFFLTPQRRLGKGRLVYRPALWARARLHFTRSTYGGLDAWQARQRLLVFRDQRLPENLWEGAQEVRYELELDDRPEVETADFAAAPPELSRGRSYRGFANQLKDFLYRTEELELFKCPALKAYSEPGESEGDFRARLRHQAHEVRDVELEQLRRKYAARLESLEKKIRSAERKLQKEKSEATQHTLQSAISLGGSLLNAFLGRKSRLSTRSLGTTAKQRGDVAVAADQVEQYRRDYRELDDQLQSEIDALRDAYQVDQLELERLTVPPKKSDLDVHSLVLLWTPWSVDQDGIAEPLYDLQENYR